MLSTGLVSGLRAAVLPTVLLAAAVPLAAQRYGLREVRDVGTGGINLVVGVPVGEFGRNIDVAGGVDVFGAFNLGRGSPVALRLDGSYLLYGHDRTIVTQPYYPLAINTTYSIATFGVGPQLTSGLLVMLGSRHTSVALDLGARYLYNGDAWYVLPGDVVPQPNGNVFIYPAHSRADLVMIHLGVSVGIR